VADVHRMHKGGAASQQHVGEAAGGGADVEAHQSGRVEREVIKRAHQLEAAARHPGVVLAAQLERLTGGEKLARFVDAPLAGKQPAGEDERLSPAAALHQAAIQHELVRALFRGGLFHRMHSGASPHRR